MPMVLLWQQSGRVGYCWDFFYICDSKYATIEKSQKLKVKTQSYLYFAFLNLSFSFSFVAPSVTRR
jgi:hypothetical protein